MESRSYTARDLCARAFLALRGDVRRPGVYPPAIRNVTHSVLDRTGQ